MDGWRVVPRLRAFGGAGLVMLFHGMQTVSTRTWDKYTFPVFALVSFGIASIFAIPFLTFLPAPVLAIGNVLHPIFWFGAKVGTIVFLFIWIRGTLPRFRFDQLMKFTWTFLFPVSILQLLATGLVVALWK